MESRATFRTGVISGTAPNRWAYGELFVPMSTRNAGDRVSDYWP